MAKSDDMIMTYIGTGTCLLVGGGLLYYYLKGKRQQIADIEDELLYAYLPMHLDPQQESTDIYNAVGYVPLGTAEDYNIGEYITDIGRFVRTLDMNRRTRDGRLVPHWGLDIAAPSGIPVHAAMGGNVVISRAVCGYGECIGISHGDVSTFYAHLSARFVEEGGYVRGGNVIGEVGGTNYCPSGDRPPDWDPVAAATMSPHLHFEVHPNSVPVLSRSFRRLEPTRWLASNEISLFRDRWERT